MNNSIQTPNWGTIPAELIALPHWVCWKLETREGKATKVPYNARSGAGAMSNNKSTWSSFVTARKAYEQGFYQGVGFMLDPQTEIIGVDLDHCLNPETGEINSLAQNATALLQTYTEITPSGTGLRYFLKGKLPERGRKKGPVEMYASHRFLTITGNHIADTPISIENREAEILEFHQQIFGEIKLEVPQPIYSQPSDLNDREILEKMFASKTGEKAKALYEGAFQNYFSSQSEADSALCFMLAFWTQRDEVSMDRIFRSSGLMRGKWDERRATDGRTYGQITVSNAARINSNSYAPPQRIILRRGAARRYAKGMSAEQAAEWNEESSGADEDEKALNSGLYASENGRTVLRIVKSTGRGDEKKEVEEYSPVADLVATISQEFRDESGKAIFGVEGRTRNGRRFEFEIEADKITDPKIVSSKLSNMADAGCVFYAGKEKHLGPAIKSFSEFEDVEIWRRFKRTGWTIDGKEFIVPGMEAPDMSITLGNKLAFHVEKPNEEQLSRGKLALKALLKAQRSEVTSVCLAHLLAPPMAFHADWRGERSALFITGRTGSFKSAWSMLGMCLYGEEFANEDNILKFAAGATNNSRMKYFTGAGDMPLLVDNYKPGNGKGEVELTELIHTSLEGGEKERLNRSSEHRDAAPIHCWPVFTGEDVIHDAAGAARCLIVPFPLAPEDASAMTEAQKRSHDLHFIGGALISWLLTEDGRAMGEEIKRMFGERRRHWSTVLREERPDMVNIFRVASNIAVNECAWEYALSCPELADVLFQFKDKHAAGIKEVATSMGQHTAQSLEANRYLEAIRSMLSSEQAYLCPRLGNASSDERRLKLGWEDDNGVYLIPETAFTSVVKLLRESGGLNNVSKGTIHKQLDQIGVLARRGKDEFTVRVKAGADNHAQTVLHLKAESIYGVQDNADS